MYDKQLAEPFYNNIGIIMDFDISTTNCLGDSSSTFTENDSAVTMGITRDTTSSVTISTDYEQLAITTFDFALKVVAN